MHATALTAAAVNAKAKESTRPRRRRPTNSQRLGESRVSVLEISHPRYKFQTVLYHGGKRVDQKYFKTKGEANTKADEFRTQLINSGVHAAATITSLDQSLIVEAGQRLAPYGKTLRDALDHYLTHLGRTAKSINIRDLADHFLLAKHREKKSRRYQDDLRVRLDRFAKDFGTRNAADITPAEISTWLTKLEVAPVTLGNFRRVLVVMFNFATENNFAPENPATKAIKPAETDSEIGILTPGDTAGLMKTFRPELVPMAALGFFAGIREAELFRLDWSDLDFDGGHVEIKPSKAKSARRRLIKIRPNLRAWLEPHRQISGPIIPRASVDRVREMMKEDRRRYGFGPPGTETLEEKAQGGILRPWLSNAARHSFASYALAKDQDLSGLALEMGHNSTAILFQHYRELVRPKAAETYWNIYPDGGHNNTEQIAWEGHCWSRINQKSPK